MPTCPCPEFPPRLMLPHLLSAMDDRVRTYHVCDPEQYAQLRSHVEALEKRVADLEARR